MIFNRKSKNKNMNEESKQENKRAAGDEQVILEDVNPVSNEENIENPDEIKSRIEEDIKDVTENAAEKDWAADFKMIEDKYIRLYAEFDNFRRRTAAERLELFKTSNQEMLVALLPVLDDFERAMKSIEQAKDIQAVKLGVELVSSKMRNILSQKGMKVMECIGKDFDSEFHEAITNIPAPTEELKGKVVDVVENGYFLNDKVVRFAKVVVGE